MCPGVWMNLGHWHRKLLGLCGVRVFLQMTRCLKTLKIIMVVKIKGTLNSRPLTFMAADDLEEPLLP